MAITFMCGWELGTTDEVDFTTSGGSPVTSTLQARTGSRSFRAATGNTNISFAPTGTINYFHFGLYIATLPSANMIIMQLNGINLLLTTTGNLRVGSGGSDSTVTLSTGTWYWIGYRGVTGTSVVLFQIDGVDQVTGNFTSSGTAITIGTQSAGTVDVYYDDLIGDDAGFVAPTKVSLLAPISDNARATLWTTGAGGTTALWDAVDNVPPGGLASGSETATSSIKHAGGAAGTTDAYDANLQSYTTAGVTSGATIVAVQSFIRCGADIATGTKLLAVGLVSNPAESLSGSFTLPGVAHGADSATTPTSWITDRHAATISPSVTLGTSPVLRVNRPETASRVACVDFMGLYVAWRPAAAAAANPPHSTVYPQILAH